MGVTKTFVLMTGLMLIFMYVGELLGGADGMKTAFIIACAINLFSYFFSDKLVLAHYKAQRVDKNDESGLYQIVQRLAERANLPMPKVYIIPDKVPNAFATGRNPSHAAVAANQGLLDMLSEEEIEGVLAHEKSHVKHRDILIGSVAAIFVSAITYLARMSNARYSNNRRSGLLVVLGAVLIPIAATIIQMTISRTREYAADAGAAQLTGHPEWLMSALAKLDNMAKQTTMQRATPETAHMFIVNPFSSFSKSLATLFSTHPSTEKRIARLAEIKKAL